MGPLFRFLRRHLDVLSLKFRFSKPFSSAFKMVREDKSTWKANYFTKIIQLLDEYPKCFLVEADNVGSKQMQQIRIALRGHAVVLMGKNTMMRKAIRGHLQSPTGIAFAPYQGKYWIRFHQGRPCDYPRHGFGK